MTDYLAAYNAGADARIRGARLFSCPYGDHEMSRAWRRGWRETEDVWGESVPRNQYGLPRWDYQSLPVIGRSVGQ